MYDGCRWLPALLRTLKRKKTNKHHVYHRIFRETTSLTLTDQNSRWKRFSYLPVVASESCHHINQLKYYFFFFVHMIWSLCETSQHFLFLKVIHLGVFPPLSPRQMSHIKSLCVYVCLSVCCGLLNGHSRWWKAPRQAGVGLEHTPSGKPQHLLYQPMTAWPCRLLAPFLCLSVPPPPRFSV